MTKENDLLNKNQFADAFVTEVYEELRSIAYQQMAAQPMEHTLQPTALVHEAWLKLSHQNDRIWNNKSEFIAVAATAMRHILIDHARQKLSQKRGKDFKRVELDQIDQAVPDNDEVILIIDEALTRLEKTNPEWARIVVLKYFGGMTNAEVAEVLHIGERSVGRLWSAARVWLHRQISRKTGRENE